MPATQAHEKEHFKIDYRSLTWYLASRAAVITFLLGGASVFYLRGNVASSSVVPLLILVAVSYAQALFSALILRWVKRFNLFAQVQIVWDLLFVTVLILLTGGVESLFSFAYLLVIVSASFLLPRRETVFAAASAAIMFGGILDLQYFNYLQNLELYRSVPDSVFLSAVFVHVVAFLLTAVLSGTLAERWRFSEAELTRKKIDFAELEKLNRTILSHISSGLMLVSPNGTILSFNRAASEITGFKLEDIYNQQVQLFFPDLPLITADGYQLVSRKEGTIFNAAGQQLILGYATTIAKGYDGEELGLLVTFQDLTQLKKIEEDLKRADRLAAVGRLASGLAHEIRNPLASISGSVQLLLEAEHVAKEDRRLMGIVVKEAERLSELLTDFLTFARPKPPQKEEVDICAALDELSEMLAGDKRFKEVEIRTDCAKKSTLFIDRGQIWQVLWDLAINAAEAIQGEGVLLLRYASDNNQIIVEDSGPGVSSAIVGKIFDPFFSTKEKGTGLGLASVYAVVEAHGGRVEVSSSDNLGGARFVLDFS